MEELDISRVRMWAIDSVCEIYEGEGMTLAVMLAEADRMVKFVTTGRLEDA